MDENPDDGDSFSRLSKAAMGFWCVMVFPLTLGCSWLVDTINRSRAIAGASRLLEPPGAHRARHLLSHKRPDTSLSWLWPRPEAGSPMLSWGSP